MPRTPSKSATSGKSTQPQISVKLLEELIPGLVTKEVFEDIFQNFKKAFIERALNAEMNNHLGYGACCRSPTLTRKPLQSVPPRVAKQECLPHK